MAKGAQHLQTSPRRMAEGRLIKALLDRGRIEEAVRIAAPDVRRYEVGGVKGRMKFGGVPGGGRIEDR